MERFFDQVVKGDVKIIRCKSIYKIIFISESVVTMYQVWDKNSPNDDRIIENKSLFDWIKLFLEEKKLNGFTPTTLLEIGDKKWAFVIQNAYISKKGLPVFCASTKEINNQSCSVKNGLPLGHFPAARFDIDNLIIFKPDKLG